MGEGLQMASLATLIGKPNAARWGRRRITIGAVGRTPGGTPFVMGTLSDGTVVHAEPSDFTIPPSKGKGKR